MMNNQEHPHKHKLKVLTVGDGDLTFSLALKRAYPQNLTVVASTLLASREALIRTYSNSSEALNELQNVWKQHILFGVDATRLESTLLPSWEDAVKTKSHCSCTPACLVEDDQHSCKLQFDMIIFNHPHLGDAMLHESEQSHAQRHFSLLSHYFHSAKQFLVQTEDGVGRIHVCLCGTQPQTWNVIDAAKCHGFECIHKETTASPVHKWLFANNCIHESIVLLPQVVGMKHTNRLKQLQYLIITKHQEDIEMVN